MNEKKVSFDIEVKCIKEPFPWRERDSHAINGWWHENMGYILLFFAFDGGYSHNYHIQAITTNPSKFGVSEHELEQTLQSSLDAWRAEERYDKVFKKWNVYLNKPDTTNKTEYTVKDYKRLIMDAKIDWDFRILRMVYEKGWVKIHTGKYNTMEGTKKSVIKRVLREQMEFYPDASVEIAEIGQTGSQTKQYSLLNELDKERYLNS